MTAAAMTKARLEVHGGVAIAECCSSARVTMARLPSDGSLGSARAPSFRPTGRVRSCLGCILFDWTIRMA